MDWKTIAPLVGAVAPFAGKLLGDIIPFPGGAIIGEQFGKIIARQFGVPETPAAVAAAIAANPNEVVLAKINQAIETARIEVQGFVEIEKAYLHAVEVGLMQTGETMRLEVRPENRHWFFTGWRPACGWVLVAHAFTFGCMLAIATFRAAFFDNAVPLNAISDAWKVYLAYFGALGAVVGVAIFARSEDKKHGVDTSTVAAKPLPPIPTPKPPPIVKPANKPGMPPPVLGRD